MDNQTLFKANIIDLLGLQNLPEEQKARLLQRMSQAVQDRISDRVASKMNDAQRTEMDKLLAQNASPEQIDVFMKQAVPDFEEIAAEELLKFKQEMKENTDAVRSMIAE
ncbi:MAG: hypothetical protein HY420_04085 [Candidatus Kerfeldbacteria bacterium]|nr:hypothetical protein [Candidatus Kerfeldbacteria bacterium]